MSYKSLQTYNQSHVSRYIVLTVCLSTLAVVVGIFHLFNASVIAYQLGQNEQTISEMNQKIAQLESAYYEETKNITAESAKFAVQQYSPASENLRYARVGGATYSLLTQTR